MTVPADVSADVPAELDASAMRVLRGAPTAEELAALIAVLCSRPTGATPLTGYAAWRARRLAALSGRAAVRTAVRAR
ncbi:MAG TPA: acyl-CoA carboxylase epsilon subunit [Sporichthya sp.]|nr:acyl-CoA carboxylase epsilon subunit [Sporichthya sp.]